MQFSQLKLNLDIQKALADCGYTEPTPIQSKSIPEILEGKDVVASAQTGTGKTAAFVLPILNRLSEGTSAKKNRILILTPTRELATQINKAIKTYGSHLKIKTVTLVGGMPYYQQIKDLASGAHIIVATPGRLLDHMEQKRINLSQIEVLVLDEADRMLDMGFIDDVEYIAKLTPSNRQTLLFSATLDNKLMQHVRNLLNKPVRIDLSQEKMVVPRIKQTFYRATSPQHKNRLLMHFLGENIYKAVIFSGTKIGANKLAIQLQEMGYSAAALHGDLRQNVRNRTLEKMKAGHIQYLVATDVAARGIDIRDITHVINYDLPRFCEDYVHRIGRTGRAGKEGAAISFVLPTENKHLRNIERYTTQQFTLKTVDLGDSEDQGGSEGGGAELQPRRKRGYQGEGRRRAESDGSYRSERSSSSRSSGEGRRSERSSYRSGNSEGRREGSSYRSGDSSEGRRSERSSYRSSSSEGRGERSSYRNGNEDRSTRNARSDSSSRKSSSEGYRSDAAPRRSSASSRSGNRRADETSYESRRFSVRNNSEQRRPAVEHKSRGRNSSEGYRDEGAQRSESARPHSHEEHPRTTAPVAYRKKSKLAGDKTKSRGKISEGNYKKPSKKPLKKAFAKDK